MQTSAENNNEQEGKVEESVEILPAIDPALLVKPKKPRTAAQIKSQTENFEIGRAKAEWKKKLSQEMQKAIAGLNEEYNKRLKYIDEAQWKPGVTLVPYEVECAKYETKPESPPVVKKPPVKVKPHPEPVYEEDEQYYEEDYEDDYEEPPPPPPPRQVRRAPLPSRNVQQRVNQNNYLQAPPPVHNPPLQYHTSYARPTLSGGFSSGLF